MRNNFLPRIHRSTEIAAKNRSQREYYGFICWTRAFLHLCHTSVYLCLVSIGFWCLQSIWLNITDYKNVVYLVITNSIFLYVIGPFSGQNYPVL